MNKLENLLELVEHRARLLEADIEALERELGYDKLNEMYSISYHLSHAKMYMYQLKNSLRMLVKMTKVEDEQIQKMNRELKLEKKFDGLVKDILVLISSDIENLSWFINMEDIKEKGSLIRRIMNTFEIEYDEAKDLADKYAEYGLELNLEE